MQKRNHVVFHFLGPPPSPPTLPQGLLSKLGVAASDCAEEAPEGVGGRPRLLSPSWLPWHCECRFFLVIALSA
jgi:hypothetical protein